MRAFLTIVVYLVVASTAFAQDPPLVQHPKLADDDALALLEAAIAEDDASVRTVATRAGLSAAITAAAAALATMPLMQACRRA